jgi:hypothetical protein
MWKKQMIIICLGLRINCLQILLKSSYKKTWLILSHFIGTVSSLHLNIEIASLVFVSKEVVHFVVIGSLGNYLAILATFRLVSNVWR